jgi:hypothetical protein
MSTSFANAAWPACHSALRLDRWMAGELPAAEAEDLSAHVASCARCREAAASLAEARDRTVLPPLRATRSEAEPTPRRAPRWFPWAALGASLAAAAAAIVILAPRIRPDLDLGLGDARLKGSSPALGMYVQHGDVVRRAGPGERVAPGDAVRFAVTLREPAYVAVLTLDPVGNASVYYPAGARAEPVNPGADVALPLATRLDQTLGEERVFGLFCDRPVELEPVRARLGALASGFVPPGCQVARWSFEKR